MNGLHHKSDSKNYVIRNNSTVIVSSVSTTLDYFHQESF